MEKINFKNVAEYCKKEYQLLTEQIVKKADEVCENYFVFDMPWDLERTEIPAVFNDKINWGYMPTSDKEFIYQFNRHCYFVTLGQAYHITKDEKYAKHFVRLISDWIDNTPYSKNLTDTMWRSLEVGLRGEYWTTALRIFEGVECVENIKDKILQALKVHKEILIKTHSDRMKFSNWGVLQNHGLFDIALALGERDVNKDTLKIAIDRLCEESYVQLMDDGVHWEQSSTYHAEVLKCFIDVLLNSKLIGLVLPKELHENVYRMARVSMYWQKPNGHHPLVGDSDDNDTRDMNSACAYLFSDGEIKHCGYPKLDFESVWKVGIEGADEYAKIKAIVPKNKSIALIDSGNYILRSGYDSSANYLHMITGYTGGGHGHFDKLHIDLMIDGEEVLVDGGRYTYVPNQRRKELKSAIQHNTIALNGRDFLKHSSITSCWGYSKTAISVNQPIIIKDDYEMIKGGNLGYVDSIRGGYIGRTVLWLKPNVYILIDNFEGRGYNKLSSYFHFDNGGKMEKDENRLNYTKGKLKVNFYFFGGKAVRVKEISSNISSHYNHIEKNQAVEVSSRAQGKNNHVTVIASGQNTVTYEKIYNSKGTTVSAKKASGYTIKNGTDIFTVIISHSEMMCWLKTKGDIGGIGRLVIYKNGKLIGNHF